MTNTHKEMLVLLYKANCLAALQLHRDHPNLREVDSKFLELINYLNNVLETVNA